MARGKGGTTSVAPHDGKQDFALNEHQADSMRAASDATAGEGEPDPIETFWARMGREIGFDPETIVMVSIPDSGPVAFRATPVAKSDAPADGPTDDETEGFDAEGAHNAGLQQMEAAADRLILAGGTMVGDLTAGMLEIIRNLQKPWGAHSQQEKRDLVAKVEHIAQKLARKAVDVVAADERTTVKAMLDKITIADKVTINLSLAAMIDDEKAEAVAQLFHAQKKPVLIVTADADRYMGKRREHVEADEEELPFDAGRDPQPAPPADDSDPAVETVETVETGDDKPDDSAPASAE